MTHGDAPSDNYSKVIDLSRVHFSPTPYTVSIQNETGGRADAKLIGWHVNGQQVFLTANGYPALLPGWHVTDIWCVCEPCRDRFAAPGWKSSRS